MFTSNITIAETTVPNLSNICLSLSSSILGVSPATRMLVDGTADERALLDPAVDMLVNPGLG